VSISAALRTERIWLEMPKNVLLERAAPINIRPASSSSGKRHEKDSLVALCRDQDCISPGSSPLLIHILHVSRAYPELKLQQRVKRGRRRKKDGCNNAPRKEPRLLVIAQVTP
jgi:hypothetical protein